MTTCLSTGVAFCGIFALACAEIKILSDQSFWTKKMTYIYTFRVFGFFFLKPFFTSPFALFLMFLLQWLTFYWLCFPFKNFRESIIETGNFCCHGVANCVHIFQAALSQSLWSGYHWKDFMLLQTLGIDDTNFGHRWMGSYRQHRSQWDLF